MPTSTAPPARPPGTFVISLDFELNWGVRDQQTLAAYGPNLLGVRQAVPAMLALFAEYGLHVTWATVGLLFFDTKADLLAHLPAVRPAYADANLSPYPSLPHLGPNEAADPYHYGRSLLAQVMQVPGQEIGTHTFCHYYCLEPGQTPEAFRHDLRAAVAVAQERGLTLRSLVFPRNQYNARYLDICAELGLSCYRGNEAGWLYAAGTGAAQTPWRRAGRLLDAYLNVSGHNTYDLRELAGAPPYNVPASRFLRPWSARLRAGEGLRVRRILSGMSHAARHGRLFHLWWHPHNFGQNLPQNLAVLRQIADHFRALQRQYGFQSCTMGEVAAQLAGGPAAAPRP